MGSILEMVIVLAAAALFTTQGIREDIAKKRAWLLATEGQNEAILNQALGKWVTTNFATLLSQYTSSGSAVLTPPTIAQLYTTGSLTQPHRNGPFWGGVYTIQMSVVPAGCSASAGTCHISYLMYPSTPLTKSGVPDVAGAAQVAQAGGSQFGYSKLQTPATITGLLGAWTTANPLAGSPAAAIVATNALDSDGSSVFYRRDGTLPLTAPLAGGGQDVNNVANVNATANVTGKALVSRNGNTTSSLANDAGGNTNLYQDNALQILKNGTSTFAPLNVGDVNSQGTVSAPNLNVNTTASKCSGNQFTVRGTNQMWFCNTSGNWIPVNQLIGNVYTIQKNLGYADGSGVGKPNCPGGTPTGRIIPQTLGVNVSANPPWQSVLYRLNDQGTWWYVQITLFDPNGGAYSGNALGLTAEVDTQCTYANQ